MSRGRGWGLLLLWLTAAPAGAAGRAVEGTDRAWIVPPGGSSIAPYANAGYRLEIGGGGGREVVAHVEVSPLGSTVTYTPPPPSAQAGSVEELARLLTVGERTRYDATSAVLAWVARNVRYELDRSQEQSPEAVLERRSGYCTGVAGLSVALLEAVGIPAREVAGYVVASSDSELKGYHRWIEVFYSDRGWVFSDPLATHHYVPATYLPLADDAVVFQPGQPGVLKERQKQLQPADVYPATPGGITGRRNSSRQLAGVISVSLSSPTTGQAILSGGGLRRVQPLSPKGNSFVGLSPGQYSLTVELVGGRSLSREIDLPTALRAALHLPFEAHLPQERGGTTEGWHRETTERRIRSTHPLRP